MPFSIYLIIIYLLLVAFKPTRKMAFALFPWLLFGCSYDAMRIVPNYEVNTISIKELYEAEKSLCGISDGGITLIPSEYFQLHHHAVTDFMAGIFYLCWVPVPLAFAFFLYLRGQHTWCVRFSWAFLLVNVIGFIGYYIYPAAPPWYVMNVGFEPVTNTPGSTAGLAHFDTLIGLPLFQSIYGNISNVFAAIPSLHAAYLPVAFIYAIRSRQKLWIILLLGIIMVGIWWTAVYTAHHYIIDVLFGILTALIGVTLCSIIEILSNIGSKRRR